MYLVCIAVVVGTRVPGDLRYAIHGQGEGDTTRPGGRLKQRRLSTGQAEKNAVSSRRVRYGVRAAGAKLNQRKCGGGTSGHFRMINMMFDCKLQKQPHPEMLAQSIVCPSLSLASYLRSTTDAAAASSLHSGRGKDRRSDIAGAGQAARATPPWGTLTATSV